MSKSTVSALAFFLKQNLRVELAFKAYENRMKAVYLLKKTSVDGLETKSL